jgi:subtilisin family serine protease
MKRKNVMRTALSVLLVLAMVLGIVGCGAKQATVNDAPNAPQLSVQQPDSSEQPSQGEALTREEKEQIADLLSDGTIDPGKLSDKELDQVVQNLTAELEKPAPEVEFNSGAYDENGAMKEPFDQVYPELVEKGEVEYDDESLLVKLASDRVTDGLKSAGVAALDCIVPMENYSWYEAKLVSGTDAQKALAQLRELKEVKLAEYNYQIKTAAIDQYQEFEEHLDLGKNQNHNKQWHMHHCGIPDGFEEVKIGGGSSSVVVAVIDTGVDYDHEDLSQNIWVNADEIPDNGIDDDKNGYVDDYYGVNIVAGKGNGDDDNGHGTHVAGIIAAQDNNLGTVGIAYNVKIMPIKAAMASGYLHQSDIAKAILYAYENGAEIINMSFGGTA